MKDEEAKERRALREARAKREKSVRDHAQTPQRASTTATELKVARVADPNASGSDDD